ncbi:MAG TPA: sugar phosphate isomerase/epimerase [Fimbriimonadaceae bacterium]|nr:sugar phosphate isomerase/epimerase [Fimbriimonadaceae bacterium]
MSRVDHKDITIGTLVSMKGSPDYLRQIKGYGFESYQLNMWAHIDDNDLPKIAKEVEQEIAGTAVVSSVGLYGNPLQDEKTASDWEVLIKNAKHFDAKCVCGFTGALEDKPIDENMPKFKEVFGHLAKVAEDEGVKIAFENCDMGGTWQAPKWNIAHAPRAWEMMFNEVPSPAIGLEWEPCHQMVSLIDPIPQLRKWVGKIHHIHGKDATINWDVIKTEGLRSGRELVWHRTPGFGDTNWTDVITILRKAGWTGAIDIEGWHDPVYREDLEMTGQVAGLEYLKRCRGGSYVPNPS